MTDIIRYQLDNGLNVVLQPQHTAPVVACNVWVGVGSADEEPHEAGLAHVHEHMLFKGTQRRGVGELAREVESAGGHINAFTSFDQTCYYVVMSSRFVETGVDILADAIRHSAFDAEELGRELEVIQEEIKRSNDDPGRVVSKLMFETAYAAHPYRLPVIGTKQSVDSFGRDHVLAFFRKHYRPDNMTVVLAGDVTESTARELVQQHFGDFEAGPHSRPQRPIEPPQTELRYAVQSQPLQSSYLRLAFHIPEILHEDSVVLDVLGAILGFGESSHLHRTIQRERELVKGISAGTYTPRDAGLFMVAADYELDGDLMTGDRAQQHEDVLEAILTEVFRFREIEPSAQALARVRTLIESREIYGKQTVEGIAMNLGRSLMVTGDPEFDAKYYAALAAVTAADVRRVARQYLTPANLTVCLLHPDSEASPTHDAVVTAASVAYTVGTRAPAPSATTERPARTGEVVVVDIPNGPRVVVQEDHAVETFSIRAVTHGGVRAEDSTTNGSSWLLGELLVRGTPSRDAEQIAEEVESMASSLEGIAGRNTVGLAAGGLSRFFDETFQLFADCLLNATIPPAEFEREQRLLLQNLRARQDRLGAVNADQFAEAFFGTHPYAMPTFGTEASVSALTADALREFYQRVLRPSGLVIAVVGDVDAGHVIERISARFVRPEPSPSVRPEIALPAPRTSQLRVTRELAKEQAFVTIGFDAPTLSEDARYTMDVLNAILSGQGGRLFYELRDRQSLAYSVYASALPGLDVSAFTINIGTSPEKIEQAVDGIFAEVARLRSEPPTVEEVARAQRYLIGSHDIGLQRNSARAMGFALDELYGFGYQRTLSYSGQIAQVTADDVARFVDTYLDASTAVIAITHPPEVAQK